jgi:hypothetical protein
MGSSLASSCAVGLACVVVSVSLAACGTSDGGTGAIDVQDAGIDPGTGPGPGGDAGPVPDAADAAPPPPACGRNAKPCKEGEKCDGPPDCLSGVCRANVCQAAKPADGVKNGDETDVDCGGSAAPACGDGKGCAIADDCLSAVCTGAVCQAPTDTDGVKNGDETGVDCGGSASNKCPTGEGCKTTDDCDQVQCDVGATSLCLPPGHDDGFKNDGETGVDCGGDALPKKCGEAEGCASNADCDALKCDVGATNECLPPSHTDGVKNLAETGVDCGGDALPALCPQGQGCGSNADCDALKCDVGVTNLCLPPSHTDGVKNLGETGIDCGGAAAPAKKCPPGQGCANDGDCNNVLCNAGAGVCSPPASNDGLKNGTETDVDCGGGAPTNAPKCGIDKTCGVGGDCLSGGCPVTGRCALPSCTTAETAGINSCGAGETGQAGAVHESCCKSLVLPTRNTRRLDKYEITAGRFRTFLTKAGPDIRSFVTSYVAAHPTSQLAALVNLNAATITQIYPNADRFVPHSLTAHMALDIDNYNGIRGCYNGDGNYSANTYWMDMTHYGDFGLPPRPTPRSVSDEKSLNCAMPIMFAAFCAWDGGELATVADLQDAWGPDAYPWGPADLKRPNYNWCNGTYQNGGFTCQCDGIHNIGASCPAGGFSVNGEDGVFYEYPIGTDRSIDNEPLIAAPGRLTGDATARKSNGESWMDLYANMVEYTGDFSASSTDWCDFSTDGGAGGCSRSLHAGNGVHYTNIPTTRLVGASWEGHVYGRSGSSTWPATGQYGKFGGRCARPANPY